MSAIVERKLVDLRVVELKNELDKRGLDKTGVKALLISRLQEALRGEGSDPETHVFKVVEQSQKKPPKKLRTFPFDLLLDQSSFVVVLLGEDTEKDTGEEEEEEVVMEAAECFGELADEAELQGKCFNGCGATSSFMVPSLDRSTWLLLRVFPSNFQNPSDATSSSGLEKLFFTFGSASVVIIHLHVAKSDEELLSVPSPEAIEPKCPFSVEDTICLHDSNSANFEQSESLIVHIGPSTEADRMDTLTSDISCEGNMLDGHREEDEADDTDVGFGEQPAHPVDERTVEMNESSCEVECTVAEADSQAEERFGDENKASSQEQQKDEFQEVETPSNSSKSTSDYSGTSLWVTGISPAVRAADIKAHFSKYGRVQLAKIVTCAKLPGSKCYGFITMVTPEEATKCIEVLNHSELNGKRITVERAKSDQLVTQKGQTSGGNKKVASAATPVAATAVVTATTTTTTTSTTTAPSKKTASAPTAAEATDTTTSTPSAGAEATESGGKEKKDETASRARSKEKPRSSSKSKEERHRKRSRSRSRSRSTRRRHYYDGDDYNRNYRGRPVMGRMLRRPMGRGPFLRRMMRNSYPPRYVGMNSRYYEDRHSRESEYERMKMREKEYMQREEMLRIEREKARLRADRERLEREKLELQQQRMRLSYESSGGPGNVPGSGAGMKRMYDGSPYTPKRISYPGPGGYDTRIGIPRERPSGSYRRPDYGDARDVRRSGGPPERYDYRGDRSAFSGGARSGSGDHRSAPRLTSMNSAGANGSSRTDTRRMSPPSSSMSRRGRPAASWNSSGRSGNFSAHNSGGSPWSESVGGGGQGSGWSRSGPSTSANAWGSGCFSSSGGGNNSDQYGSGGDRFDSYGKYSGLSSSIVVIAMIASLGSFLGRVPFCQSKENELMEKNKGKPPTVLTFALVGNNTELFELLISQGADVNELDKNGRTLVHWAVACGRHTILKKLIDRGANLSLRDHSGAHALHYATQLVRVDQSISIVQLLLPYVGGPDKMDAAHQTPLFWVSLCKDRLPIAKMLRQHGASINIRNIHGMTGILHSAASSDNSNFIQMILDDSCTAPVDSPDRNGFTPLFYAAASGSVDCMRLLLDHGASVNHRSSRLKTVAHYCAFRGDVNALKLLQSWGARLDLADEFGLTVLHEAVQSHNLACVKWLLRCVNDVNCFDCLGRTALHIAVAMGDTAVAAALLERGADSHAVVQDKGRFIAAATIAARRNDKVTSELLAHFASIVSVENSNSNKRDFEKKWKSNIAGQRKEHTIAVPLLEEQKQESYRHETLNVLRSSVPVKTSAEIEQTPKQVATLPLSVSRLAVADRCASISTGRGTIEAFTGYDQLCPTEKLVTAGKKTSSGQNNKPAGDSSLSNERNFVGEKAVNFTSKALPQAADLSAKPVLGSATLLKPISSTTSSHKNPESGTQSPARYELCTESQPAHEPFTNVLSAVSAKVRSMPGTVKEARNFENSTWKTQWVFNQFPSICRSSKVLPFIQLEHAKTLHLRAPERKTFFTTDRFSGGCNRFLRTVKPSVTSGRVQKDGDKSLLVPISRSRSLDQKKSMDLFVPRNGHRTPRNVDNETVNESSSSESSSSDFCHSPWPATAHVMERNTQSLTRSQSSDQFDYVRSNIYLNKLLKYADDLQVGVSPARSLRFPNVRLVPPFLRECSKLIDGHCELSRSTSILESALPLQRLEKRISEELLNIKHIEQAYHKIQEDKLVQGSVRHFLDFVNVPTLDRLARGERFRKFQDWIAFLKGILRRLREADAVLFGELERDRNSRRSKLLISGGKNLLSSSHSGLLSVLVKRKQRRAPESRDFSINVIPVWIARGAGGFGGPPYTILGDNDLKLNYPMV
ncbi:Ankyrin repeat protein [Trichuris trichiura]|uniref:Ankyrin repeat protein n=1 Tax=Trichuris trichiura TaxID=36087 RepID=A0A077YYR3_TRITR|nr:Ankyrin repeat protein [Trichuris trichiura]